MHWARFACVLAVSLGYAVAGASGQLSGVKGVVNDKIKGAEGYNQAIEDAINGTDQTNRPPVNVAADGIKSGWMRRTKDAREVRLFFAYPAALDKSKPAAAIILVQEEWGVNDEMQERAREFARKGFYAVAPDLYYGKVTDDPKEAAKFASSLTNPAAMTAMRAGLDLLGEEGKDGLVDLKRVGVVGWGLGAQQALLLSMTDPRVKATALFYGTVLGDAARLRSLQGPVLGIFGNDDKAPGPAEVTQFKAGLKGAGKTDVTIYQFDGVGHAFASKSAAKSGAYNETKAQEAMDKMWAWMDAKLPRK